MTYLVAGLFTALLVCLWVICTPPASEYERKEIQKYKDGKRA